MGGLPNKLKRFLTDIMRIISFKKYRVYFLNDIILIGTGRQSSLIRGGPWATTKTK